MMVHGRRICGSREKQLRWGMLLGEEGKFSVGFIYTHPVVEGQFTYKFTKLLCPPCAV